MRGSNVHYAIGPFKTPLVVCGESQGDGTIIMAVTPYLKELGLGNVMRKFDLPKALITSLRNRGWNYILKNLLNLTLYYNYFGEDWYPYSIDETFIHLTPYLKLYNKSRRNY